MARIASGTIVAGLTAGALAVIGVLAWQADAAPDHGRTRLGAAADAHPGAASPRPAASVRAGTALPTGSGSGRRVVYSLSGRRIWLVRADGRVERTFAVQPGTVSPPPGTYAVTSRTPNRITGSDGLAVERVVRFGTVDRTVLGFSAVLSDKLPTPDPARRSGGVRERLADGFATYDFAPVGTPVVVVS